MKAYYILRNSVLTSILLLIVTLTGCSPTRYIADDQALVKKARLKGVDKDFIEQATLYIQKEVTPNSRLNLALYNLVNTKKGKYRTDRIRNVGEAPHILDSSLVEISRTQIEKFLATKGFFKAQVKDSIIIKNKKADIIFTAVQGPSFKVRNIDYVIPDTAVKALYDANRARLTKLKPGNRYDRDSLYFERDEVVYRLMKQNGYYDYLRQYMRVDVDTNLYSSEADLKIYIDNPENKPSHPVYTINNTFFTIKNSTEKIDGIQPDSAVIDSQYYFKDYSLKFRPKILSRYLFLRKNDIYNVDNETVTYNRLYELNVFNSLRIDYVKTSDSTNRLNPRIEAVPLKRMSNRMEGEYTFNSGRSGFNIGDTYTNRNLFRGAEQLELKLRYGVLFDSRVKGNLLERIFNRDFQIGVNYILPRLLVPFFIRQSSRNGLPHTTISSSLQLFDQQKAFTNRLFINSLTYNWVETAYKLHGFTPINIEYRDGRLDNAFKEELRKFGRELYIRTNDRQYFNLGSQYTFTFNGIRLNTYDNFFFFKGTADLGGNTLHLLSSLANFKRNDNGERTIFRLPYLQYSKAELDFRLYRSLGMEKQLIARINPGLIYPNANGNTQALPFEKNFYAGGSSGVRAWQARTLGPGNYNRAILSSDTLRSNLRNLDQLGEIKLESNLEYRFKIVDNFFGSKLKGAAFTDVGNVWRLRKTVDNPDGEFQFKKFLNQLAIGAGLGLRFDLEYFVFRFDAGIKVRGPQFRGSDQWVIRHLFNNKEFKRNYEQTNAPDTYRFVQYNFGIGLPF